jgi:hypothetical protein
MSFDSPKSELGSPRVGGVNSPPTQMGGAWGGSEYLGGGLLTDMYDGGLSLKRFAVNGDVISYGCLARALFSAVTLLFIILLLAYSTGVTSFTADTAKGLGYTAVALLMASMLFDFAVALSPTLIEAKSSTSMLPNPVVSVAAPVSNEAQ